MLLLLDLDVLYFFRFRLCVIIISIINILIVVVVYDVILVLLDDSHSVENIQGVVYSSLHILEVYFMACLNEVLVHLQNFIGNLSASHHRPLSHFLKDRS